MKTNLTTTILVSALLAACSGQKTNPVSNYNLKGVPEHKQKQPEQRFLANPFVITLKSGQSKNVAHFIEGQESVATITVGVNPVVSEFELTAVEKPENAIFMKVNRDTYQLRWTPRDVLGANNESLHVFRVNARPTIAASSEYLKVSIEEEFSLIVTRTRQQPELIQKGFAKNAVFQNDVLPFTYEVKDPGSFGAEAPSVQISAAGKVDNKEGFIADGSIFVSQAGNAERLPNGNWRYSFNYSTKDKTVPTPLNRQGKADTAASEVNTCFDLSFHSPAKTKSPPYRSCVKIQFAPNAPEFVWADSSSTVTVGSTSTLKFSVKDPTGRGNVTIQNLTENFTTIAGAPVLNCPNNDAKASVRNCTIVAKVPCDSTFNSSYPIRIQASNTVNDRTEKSEITKEIKFEKTQRSCPAPKPVAVQPAAQTPAAPKATDPKAAPKPVVPKVAPKVEPKKAPATNANQSTANGGKV